MEGAYAKLWMLAQRVLPILWEFHELDLLDHQTWLFHVEGEKMHIRWLMVIRFSCFWLGSGLRWNLSLMIVCFMGVSSKEIDLLIYKEWLLLIFWGGGGKCRQHCLLYPLPVFLYNHLFCAWWDHGSNNTLFLFTFETNDELHEKITNGSKIYKLTLQTWC